MPENRSEKMIVQLRSLQQLTRTEIQISTIRQAQARTDAVRREIAENLGNSYDRSRAIDDALRDLGGVPDIVTPLMGRVAAIVKASREQAQPLQEALLGDLALEHELLDRSRYLKALAVTAGNTQVERLAARLEQAHSATVEWLTTVLVEDALGGPTALRRTPLQLLTSAALSVSSLPVRTLAERVNEVFAQARQERDRLAETVTELRDGALEVFATSRDAGLDRAERVARRDGARRTADAMHDMRRANGSLKESELPIRNYDSLNMSQVVTAVRKLDNPHDLRAILSYEEAHKARSGVISATQTQLAGIAKELLET